MRGWPKCITVTDGPRDIDPLAQARALATGDALIFRHYELETPARLELGQVLRAICTSREALFIVAGNAKLALELKADGLHLPSWQVRRQPTLPTRTDWLVTAAAHSESELKCAERAGVDACLLSPIFPTQSHIGKEGLGVVRAASIVRDTRLPVYALGGVTEKNARRLSHIPFTGFAGTWVNQ